MATFWERTVRSVCPIFSFVILDISHFGSECRIGVLVSPIPDHCLLVSVITEDD